MTAGREKEAGTWTTVIRPVSGWFDISFGDVWRYRDLIGLFVRRDFVANYKQTILGPAWHIVQPLMTTIIFTIVFGRIARISTEGTPQFLFYMSGNILWSYFSNVLLGTSNTFIGNAHLFGKVYFPRLVTPLSLLLSRLVAFAIQFALYLCFLAWYATRGADVQPNLWVLALPLVLLATGALAMGCGIIVSSMTTRYRDLTVLVGFGIQLWMYLSPIVYPLSSLPEKYRFWAMLNPVAPLLEFFRFAFLGTGTVRVEYLALSLVSTLLILLGGAVLFSRVERTFMDTV
jgi:lipopolysaccharide transport system permease protein